MRATGLAIMAMVFSASVAAQGNQLGFDPGKLKGPANATPNEVLVLGTPHLAQLPPAFDPAKMQTLLDRLASWKPHAISIEALSGQQCDMLRRYPLRYTDSVKSYCWDPAPARAATGLDVPAATMQAEQMLAKWPEAPSPAQRRRLAALFLAGGEQTSALVQWLRLHEAERVAGDGLDAVLVERLGKLEKSRNENYVIGARLAARLGHERVYGTDDHTADFVIADEKAFGEAMTKVWNNPVSAERKKIEASFHAGFGTDEGVLKMYRFYNSPEAARLAYEGDFGAAHKDPSPQRSGRSYLGFWETRNLRMVANIRDVMTERPGIRMLAIVGASHKGYFEAYLNQMHDVRVVSTAPFLK